MKNKIYLILFISIIISISTVNLSYSKSIYDKVKKGLEAFNKEKFDDALIQYRDAQTDDPESPILHYNVGTVLYKQKKYEEAIKEFEKALSIEDSLKLSAVHYNMGNTYFRMNDYQKAIESYEQCLKLNPNDVDAKYNLEYVRNLLKDNANKQQQNQQNQDNKQDKQKEEQKQEQKNESSNEKKEEDKSQQSAGEEKDKKEMSKEQAEQLLDALKNEEKNSQKRRIPVGDRRREKDW